ncbi:WRKY transcription factor 55-like isoform X2 [Brassica napus]|uniref:WRKY transcription factor 55-like isoform X2 n=1 Tax=Brassica napus TaxID=3708 RepID=UPI00207B04F5|nr:WRKY transcription factor 55-like isoform X2 [Brassica napus]
MEEILSIIFNGINQVEELKFNLSAQESPESLSSSLGSISTLFRDANERLGTLLERKNAFVPNQPEPKPVQVSGLDQMMMQIEPGLKQDHRVREGVKSIDSGPGCAFSTPRPRRRKKDGAVETVLVVAARMGNMGTPPDDNYVWRKYGQKEILGSRYPRCNHQKVYKCPAKKQVQRLDEDPYMLRVTYRSSHTCQFSTTSSFSSTATTPVNYGPNVHNMADLMFENTDSVVPFCEPYFNNDSLVPGAASYEDSWNSTWQSYDMS